MTGVERAREPAVAGSVGRPLNFMCPACGVELTIGDPGAYDGRPGPCPGCAVLVVPPRVFVGPGDGPGAAVIDLRPRPGLSVQPGEYLKTPRVVARRGRATTGMVVPAER